jgi:hypothetical protein
MRSLIVHSLPAIDSASAVRSSQGTAWSRAWLKQTLPRRNTPGRAGSAATALAPNNASASAIVAWMIVMTPLPPTFFPFLLFLIGPEAAAPEAARAWLGEKLDPLARFEVVGQFMRGTVMSRARRGQGRPGPSGAIHRSRELVKVVKDCAADRLDVIAADGLTAAVLDPKNYFPRRACFAREHGHERKRSNIM